MGVFEYTCTEGDCFKSLKHAHSDCVAQYTELPSVEDQIRLYLITTVL